MVPEAPGARFSGLGLVPVSEQFGVTGVQVPVLVAVGGLGSDTIPLWVAVEMFRTVITSRKLMPAAIALTGVPAVSVVWNELISRDLRVHDPGVFTVTRPVREMPSEKSGSSVKLARASSKVSLRSWVLVPAFKASVKSSAPPVTIELAQLVARNVTEVVLKAMRVQPAGAAVAVENSVAVQGVPLHVPFNRKRIS